MLGREKPVLDKAVHSKLWHWPVSAPPSAERLWGEFLTEENGYKSAGGWVAAYEKPRQGWKLHLLSTTLDEWVWLMSVMWPYLHHHQIFHKTVGSARFFDALQADPLQRGKTITLYAPSVSHFKEQAHAIEHRLYQWMGPLRHAWSIAGDRAFGSSGRIFYRYDTDMIGQYCANTGSFTLPEEGDPFFDQTPH